MFNETKYTRLYFTLISHFADSSGAIEKHHITPKSCGGSNDIDNIARVPPRVHFILHRLLPKMVIDKTHKNKMQQALWRMMNPQSKSHERTYIVTSTAYQQSRLRQKEFMRGENNPMKNPETASKFRRKRPEQSAVATKRNTEYWKTRKLPTLPFTCCSCGAPFESIRPDAKCCTLSCAARYRNMMRRLGK